jgi:hypothetical protein
VTNGKLFHSDYRGSRAIASVIHPVALYSPAETSLLQGQLSALSCNEISHIMANEGDRPSASDPGWQECSTIPGAIRFRLSSSNEGLHLVKVWMKKTKMAVKSDPITIPVYFDQTYPLPPTVKLNSSNPAVSAEVSITIGSCNSSTYAAVTETETPPTIESDAWQWCTTTAGAITHTLSSQTSSAHTLYIWGKKETGLISQANTVSVTY